MPVLYRFSSFKKSELESFIIYNEFSLDSILVIELCLEDDS